MPTIDELIGEKVHGALWRRRLRQVDLAPALGIDQSALSRKIRGHTSWSASDVLRAADRLGVTMASLLPTDDELEQVDRTPPRGVSALDLSVKPNNDTYPSPARPTAKRGGIVHTHGHGSPARAA